MYKVILYKPNEPERVISVCSTEEAARAIQEDAINSNAPATLWGFAEPIDVVVEEV